MHRSIWGLSEGLVFKTDPERGGSAGQGANLQGANLQGASPASPGSAFGPTPHPLQAAHKHTKVREGSGSSPATISPWVLSSALIKQFAKISTEEKFIWIFYKTPKFLLFVCFCCFFFPLCFLNPNLILEGLAFFLPQLWSPPCPFEWQLYFHIMVCFWDQEF